MPDTSAGSSQVWAQMKALLDMRKQRKWDSFSWLALRPVISSLNDRLNHYAPTLVRDLRRQWVPQHDVDDRLIVDKTGSSSFIVLGDPGEQDASQYVVVPALLEQAAGVDFMVICSDVIYPSGDVNDYVDGFYVPYKGLAGLPILALPGNHDWYDGLTGFMWHFCGAEPLPATAFRPAKGTPLREWPFRLLWRRPSKPDSRLHLEELRAERAPGGVWEPLQPGPYYAIKADHALLVCIDTGIDRCIDLAQGEWLRRVSTLPGPKVLLTGSPLVVNRERHPCLITGGPVVDPSTGMRFDSVADIVGYDGHGYVAAIGGDIHNFQHYRVEGLDHIVCGGGGAYMTATHPIPVAVEDPCTPQPDVPPAEEMFPSAPESLRHFARQLLPRVWRLVRALMAVLIGVIVGVTALEVAGDSPVPDSLPPDVLRLAPWVLAGGLAWRMLAVPASWTKTWGYRLAVVLIAFVAGLTIVWFTWWLAPDHTLRYVLAWAGLTAAGGLAAMLLRRTGWWRPPSAKYGLPGQRETHRWLPLLAAAFVLLPMAVWLVRKDWWLTTAAIVTAAAAIGGWRMRRQGHPSRPRCSWKQLAPRVSYSVQLFDAVVLLDHVGVPAVPWVMAGVAGGLGAVLLVTVVAVLVLCALLPLGVARAGFVFPLAGASLWGLWASVGGESVGQRAAFITAVLVGGVVTTVFIVDALRRRLGPPYKFVAVVIATGIFLLLLGAGAFSTWAPRAAATALVVLAMTVITVVTLHLSFLGAFSLIWDLGTHRVREQLTWAQAERVIRWRAGGTRPPQRQVRRRANIVFPGADHPRGPIQSAVSEIFDTDEPPFVKSFLVVRSDPDELTITAHVVTGTDDPPPPYKITIPVQTAPR